VPLTFLLIPQDFLDSAACRVVRMRSLAVLVGLAYFGLSLTFASAQTVDGLWLEPGAAITKVCQLQFPVWTTLILQQFQATVVVPALPSGSGYHGVWAGIEDASGTVYQTVIGDSKSAGSWEFWVEFCCS